MIIHPTTDEAKRLNLPGSDTFRSSHICYVNEINCERQATMLYREAYMAFGEAYEIKHRQALEQEADAAMTEYRISGIFSPERALPALLKSLDYMNLNYLLIACGFELALKAIILQHGFVIQTISNAAAYKALAVQQRTQPVHKNEIIAIDGFRFDGNWNYLPGLKDCSLKFSSILKNEQYRKVAGLDGQSCDIIDAFRELRNQIHFPADIPEGALAKLGNTDLTEFVVNFVNKQIVERENRIWKGWYGWRPLKALA